MQTRSQTKFLRHESCPKCGSSDGKAVYDDGSGYCFPCETYFKPDSAFDDQTRGKVIPMTNKANTEALMQSERHFKSIPDRGIAKATCEAYGVTQTDNEHWYPYTDGKGTDIAYKIRSVEDKKFVSKGNIKDAILFGQANWNGGGKFVTIVEGELDALAAYQMMGSKYPVVSIKNGAQSAVKDCQAQYEWLDSFEAIVLAFDADEPGQEAAGTVAELFGNKVKIMKMAKGYKDACDYLKDNKSADFVKAWWAAEDFKPEGVVDAESLRELIKKPLEVAPVQYPWVGLNKMLYGIRPAELVTFAAGSGLGKSTMLRELIWHILKSTDAVVGLAFLEETPERTMRGLVGLELNKKIHLPDAQYTSQEIDAVYDRLKVGERIFLWDHFGSNDIDSVINRLRYFVKALNCTYLVLDHVSVLVSDQSSNLDERRAIDMVMTKLRMFVQEMKVSLLLVSHLKRPEGKSLEDGAVTSLGMMRGSASIAQLSDAVIGAERNSQADDPNERNTTRIRVLKSRYTGYTGTACYLFYDDSTGRLREIEMDAL